MSTSTAEAHSKLLKCGMISFAVALVGAMISLVGWCAFGSLTAAKLGFPITVLGVVSIFIIVIVGQVRFGSEAIRGSIKSAHEIQKRVVGVLADKSDK